MPEWLPSPPLQSADQRKTHGMSNLQEKAVPFFRDKPLAVLSN
jgi:hypothetical protein